MPFKPAFPKDQRILIANSFPIGDGLLSLLLFHNLFIQGVDVFYYHPSIEKFIDLFPNLNELYISPESNPEELYKRFDQIILFFISDDLQKKLWEIEKIQKQNKVFALIPNLRKPDPNSLISFNSKTFMVENLQRFCKQFWCLDTATTENGLDTSRLGCYRRYRKKVIISPTAGQAKKEWGKKDFFRLATRLKQLGFQPHFILEPKEIINWQQDLQEFSYSAPNLLGAAKEIYESGYFIGNDSGLGHLASNMHIPTLTICWNKKMNPLWMPGWFVHKVVCAPWFLTNIGPFRLKSLYWRQFIPVSKVVNSFIDFTKEI